MQFKKSGSRIFGVELNKKEQQALDLEITRQIAERFADMEIELTATLLWTLHEQFGFGEKRLHVVYDHIVSDMKDLCNRYEMPLDDGAWLCTRKLKELGCDVEKWYNDEMRSMQENEK